MSRFDVPSENPHRLGVVRCKCTWPLLPGPLPSGPGAGEELRVGFKGVLDGVLWFCPQTCSPALPHRFGMN